MAPAFWVFVASCLAVTIALPAEISTRDSRDLARADQYEWTALADSYASGFGAGHMDDGSQRCVRFSDAYPRLMNADTRMLGGVVEKLNTWFVLVPSRKMCSPSSFMIQFTRPLRLT